VPGMQYQAQQMAPLTPQKTDRTASLCRSQRQ
jgi:hypothetical protein